MNIIKLGIVILFWITYPRVRNPKKNDILTKPVHLWFGTVPHKWLNILVLELWYTDFDNLDHLE